MYKWNQMPIWFYFCTLSRVTDLYGSIYTPLKEPKGIHFENHWPKGSIWFHWVTDGTLCTVSYRSVRVNLNPPKKGTHRVPGIHFENHCLMLPLSFVAHCNACENGRSICSQRAWRSSIFRAQHRCTTVVESNKVHLLKYNFKNFNVWNGTFCTTNTSTFVL